MAEPLTPAQARDLYARSPAALAEAFPGRVPVGALSVPLGTNLFAGLDAFPAVPSTMPAPAQTPALTASTAVGDLPDAAAAAGAILLARDETGTLLVSLPVSLLGRMLIDAGTAQTVADLLGLRSVAFTGNYNDLTNLPVQVIPGIFVDAPAPGDPADLYVGGSDPLPGYSQGALYMWDAANGRYAVALPTDGEWRFYADSGVTPAKLVGDGSKLTMPVQIPTGVRTLQAGTYCLTPKAAFAMSLTEYSQLKATVGSFTLTVKKNGSNVSGLTSLAVTTTPSDVACTLAVAVGDRIDLAVSGLSGSPGLEGALTGTRG